MKRSLIPIAVCCLVSSFTINMVYGQLAGNENDDVLRISILQNGRDVVITNHTVKIKKEPFKIGFGINKDFAVRVLASLKDSVLNEVAKGTPMEKMSCFTPGKGMAEGDRNEDRDITFTDSGFNYWVYESVKDCRFDSVAKKGRSIKGFRTIDTFRIYADDCGAKFKYPPKKMFSPADVPVSALKENILYLVFIWGQGTEVRRDWLEIDFE